MTDTPRPSGAAAVEADIEERLTALFSDRYGRPAVGAAAPSGRPGARPYGELDEDSLFEAIELQRTLFDAGLAAFSVPTEYGGRGLGREADRRLSAIGPAYDAPDLMPLAVGLSLVVPTLLAHGSDQQKQGHIPATLRADEFWCQLFSEPGSGSDLASLRTQAVRDGEQWVVNGQKVWTSWARHAAFGILLARTDPVAPKHRGISMFLLDMRTPGVEVRPLREMTGGWQFSEVFFTDVRVPADCLVGGLNDGWAVAMTTLTDERSEGALRARPPEAERLVRLARDAGVAHVPAIRQELVAVWMRERIVRVLAELVSAGPRDGRSVSRVSLVKIMSSELGQRVAELAVRLEGAAALAWSPEDPNGRRSAFDLAHSRMATIAGGTNEVQRNILAERVLGLPRERSAG